MAVWKRATESQTFTGILPEFIPQVQPRRWKVKSIYMTVQSPVAQASVPARFAMIISGLIAYATNLFTNITSNATTAYSIFPYSPFGNQTSAPSGDPSAGALVPIPDDLELGVNDSLSVDIGTAALNAGTIFVVNVHYEYTNDIC